MTSLWTLKSIAAACASAVHADADVGGISIDTRTLAPGELFVALKDVRDGHDFVKDAIGKGAAATKYNLFAGLANVPIGYLTVIDGWGQGKWGSGGMLYVEALAGVAAIGLFYLVVLAARVLLGRARQVQESSSASD